MTREELIKGIKVECFDCILDKRDNGMLCTQDIEEVVMHFISVYDTTQDICDKLGAE